MPYTRISLRKGKPPGYLKAISYALDRALVESFDAPEGDLFQVFDQHEPDELVFDRNYLSAGRSDDFVLLAITIGKPRSKARKEAFYRDLVARLGDDPGIRAQDVMVVITATGSENWSFSGGEMWLPKPAPAGLPAAKTIRRVAR
jgi:hypothetical protein